MSTTEIIELIRSFPAEERREVVERIRHEFAEFDDELPPHQIAELDRRAEEALKNPERCRPWGDVLADVEKRFRA